MLYMSLFVPHREYISLSYFLYMCKLCIDFDSKEKQINRKNDQ